jgi:hypothetical protein
MIGLCFVGAGLRDFVAVGLLVPLGDVELVVFGAVEVDPVGVVVDFEATVLDPEEHPASIPASTNMRKSRRIVTTPLVVVIA